MITVVNIGNKGSHNGIDMKIRNAMNIRIRARIMKQIVSGMKFHISQSGHVIKVNGHSTIFGIQFHHHVNQFRGQKFHNIYT